jgi:hypothetical protein
MDAGKLMPSGFEHSTSGSRRFFGKDYLMTIKRTLSLFTLLTLASFLTGCGTTPPPGTEKGPNGTIAYNVPVESTPPGATIEVNQRPSGTTPTTIKIFGDRDGSFHNFGDDEFVVRAYPPDGKGYPQTKIFKTGAFSIKDDKIPAQITFDFSTPSPKTN